MIVRKAFYKVDNMIYCPLTTSTTTFFWYCDVWTMDGNYVSRSWIKTETLLYAMRMKPKEKFKEKGIFHEL